MADQPHPSQRRILDTNQHVIRSTPQLPDDRATIQQHVEHHPNRSSFIAVTQLRGHVIVMCISIANRPENCRAGLEEIASAPVEQSVVARFADSIDRLYRAAISLRPTPRNKIAYGCYLAEHGHFAEAMREFDETLDEESVAGDAAILAEIIHHIVNIEHRLEDDGEPESVPDADLGAAFAGLDHRVLQDVCDLLATLWTDRMASELRRTGMTLLKLGLLCGKHHWNEIEVICVRKAIRCLEQAAQEIRGPRQQSLAGSSPH